MTARAANPDAGGAVWPALQSLARRSERAECFGQPTRFNVPVFHLRFLIKQRRLPFNQSGGELDGGQCGPDRSESSNARRRRGDALRRDARQRSVRHLCYAVTGISARLALIVARRQLIIWRRNLQRNCALRSLFSVDEWRRQRLSAGPRAVSQILRLISTSTATTLGLASLRLRSPGGMLVTDCSSRAAVRAPGASLPFFSFRAL